MSTEAQRLARFMAREGELHRSQGRETLAAYFAQAAAELRRLEAECEALKKANALLQQHHATAWNRGHEMGMRANRQIASEALKAVANDAWDNTRMTEALMASEAECEQLRADAARWRACVQVSDDAHRHPDNRERPELYGAYMKANSQGLNLTACIDAAMKETK